MYKHSDKNIFKSQFLGLNNPNKDLGHTDTETFDDPVTYLNIRFRARRKLISCGLEYNHFLFCIFSKYDQKYKQRASILDLEEKP